MDLRGQWDRSPALVVNSGLATSVEFAKSRADSDDEAGRRRSALQIIAVRSMRRV